MFKRRSTHYLIAAGILSLLSALYWGYRAYQSHVELDEFMSRAVSFQQSLGKDTQSGVDSTDSKNIQSRGNTVSLTSGVFTDQTGQEKASGEGKSKKPVKVRIMTPKEVALYSDGDPNAAVRVESQPRPPVPDGTWINDEHVSQWVELPDGEVVKTFAVPGMEIREGDRVSPQYIENVKDEEGNYIEIDGERYDISPETAADEYAREYALQKIVWAKTLKTSVQEVEQMIATHELIVKLSHETMTPEETGINLNLLHAVRPDLYEVEQPLSVSSEIKPGEVEAWLNSSSPEPLLPGEVNRLLPRQSNFPPVPSQETDDRERLSPDRFDTALKLLKLIDEYGTEEGLRRLREMDPDAAQRFERRGTPSRDAPKGHTHPDDSP